MYKIIRKLGHVLTREEKRKLYFLMLPDIVVSLADIGSLALLLFIVNFYANDSGIGRLAFLPSWLTDRRSLWLIGLFFVAFCVKNLLSFLVYRAQSRFRYKVASRISQDNLVAYLEGSFHEYANTDSAVHVLRIAQQPIEFCQFVLAGIQQGVTEGTLICVTVIAVVLFNAKLFLVLLVLLLPPVIILSYLARRRLHAARMFIQSSREIMWQHLRESIAGFAESNLYDKNGFVSGRYGRAQYELNGHLSSFQSMQGLPARLAEIFAVFGLLALIAIGHFYGHQHTAEFVTLGAFLAAAYKIIPGIARMLNITGQLKTYAFTLDGLLEKDTKGKEYRAGPLSGHNEGPGPEGSRGRPGADTGSIRSLSCRNIGFRYGKAALFDNLHLDIEAGDFLGIQGDSGKGKTTLIHIILGFLPPETGEVLINGLVSEFADREIYWKYIAYVKQQPFIIHDTLLKNITLDEEDPDSERLQRALSLSGLDELIALLPQGLDSEIAESGKNISGGQRQRIAIARALYKDADMIILDEPFSELDEGAEERILEGFGRLAGEGKLVIMITHNKRSLSFCSKTLFLDAAKIRTGNV
jgi:ABC-type multidrug transport system fused ATPase/permease subunit